MKNVSKPISRRRFHTLAGSSLALSAASAWGDPPQSGSSGPTKAGGELSASSVAVRAPAKPAGPIKCMCCDLNWVRYAKPADLIAPAAAQDWAFIDPKEYFDWHREFGNNIMFCQAYTFGGFAFYPTKLGPVAPGPCAELLPRLMELATRANMPFMSYMCVGADLVMSNHRPSWVIPKSRDHAPHGFLAPESQWTDLLCQRVREFLKMFPVDWLLCDWFVYGTLKPDEALVQPAPFVEKPFREICGRPMPKTAAEIAPEEHLKYKREVLARQFRAIRDAVRQTSPNTRICFNVPYWKADEAIWRDHPMVNESDAIFAESDNEDVIQWALRVRKPGQRVITTIFGRTDGVCDPTAWQKWQARGCDFFAYAWGAPPDFRPLPLYHDGLKVVREALRAIK